MIAWRICKREYASRESALGGVGARDYGGRWNRRGLALVYASSCSSLAFLETLVQTDKRTLPKSIGVVQITIPDDVGQTRITVADLHDGWREVGAGQCVDLGSAWIQKAEELVLSVPSAVNPLDENILLNPANAHIARCVVGSFVPIEYDSRLLRLFNP